MRIFWKMLVLSRRQHLMNTVVSLWHALDAIEGYLVMACTRDHTMARDTKGRRVVSVGAL